MENALELHVWYDYKDFLVPSVYLIEDLHVLKSISEISALFLSSGILQFSACVLRFFTTNINRKADYFFHSFPTVTVQIQRGYSNLNAPDCVFPTPAILGFVVYFRKPNLRPFLCFIVEIIDFSNEATFRHKLHLLLK